MGKMPMPRPNRLRAGSYISGPYISDMSHSEKEGGALPSAPPQHSLCVT